MPNYQYKCPVCQAEHVLAHPITDTPIYHCQNCKVELIKVFSAPPITFKGNGWGHQ